MAVGFFAIVPNRASCSDRLSMTSKVLRSCDLDVGIGPLSNGALWRSTSRVLEASTKCASMEGTTGKVILLFIYLSVIICV